MERAIEQAKKAAQPPPILRGGRAPAVWTGEGKPEDFDDHNHRVNPEWIVSQLQHITETLDSIQLCFVQALIRLGCAVQAPEDVVKRAMILNRPDTDIRACRECGCTDLAACQHDDGTQCRWVEADLCSVCHAKSAGKEPASDTPC